MSTDAPRAPEGVWLEYDDGARYDNVPTVYIGRNDDGIAMFDIIAPREEAPTSVGAGLLPGMTSVSLPMLQPGSEIP